MKGLLRATAAALALYGGVVAAQTASETTTTQSTTYPAPAYPAPAVPPPVPLAAPPPGTLATTHTIRSVDSYGNETYQQRTTYQNGQGVAQDTRTVTTTVPAPPPPPPVTTTTTTTTQQTTEDPN